MSAYIRWPSSNASLPTYANFAALPALANDGSVAVTTDTDTLYVYNLATTTWLPVASPGTVFSIGTIDTGSPSANGAHITTGALILQSASATAPGLMNLTTQTLAGNKTFTGTLAASNLSGTNTGNVTLTAVGASGNANGASLSGQALTLQPASASFPGVLTAADWATFNSKQAAGNYITALTGDGTASGPGSAALTLATVNTDVGSFGSASSVTSLTVNAKGLVTAAASTSIQIAESQVTNLVSDLAGKQPAGNYITALTGDATAAGPGSAALTLATVNANVGSFGSASAVTALTVNAKGLVTAAASTSIAIAASQITSGQVAIANGGTGAGTKAAGFDALSPMSASGDIIYGGASGTGTRLAKGSDTQILTLASGVPTWAAPATAGTVTSVTFTGDGTVLSSTPSSAVTTTGTVTAALKTQTARTFLQGPLSGSAANPTFAALSLPTIQRFTSGSVALYTTPTNPAPLYIKVKMVGAGGGGSGSGTTAGAAVAGGDSLWKTHSGSALVTASGGGAGGTNQGGVPGAGGAVTYAAGPIKVYDVSGGGGGGGSLSGAGTGYNMAGGIGGTSFLGGAGRAGTGGLAGGTAAVNSGSGGGGGCGASTAGFGSGHGGGAGGYAEFIITAPAASYDYTVGALGGAGAAGSGSGAANGGDGGAGLIIVEEYYQ